MLHETLFDKCGHFVLTKHLRLSVSRSHTHRAVVLWLKTNTTLPRRFYHRVLLGIAIGIFPSSDNAAERLSHTTMGNIETWRIDEPTVTQPQTTYPTVVFQKGDFVVIEAGGCVQTGGIGATWKLYVDPQGPNSDRLYHGLVQVPFATNGLVRDLGVIRRVLQIPQQVVSSDPLQLTLGYEDDDYHDNGYWGHDNGTGDQCKNVGPAWIALTIIHACPNAAKLGSIKSQITCD